MTVTSVHVLRYDDDRSWPQMRGARPEDATYWHPGVQVGCDSNGLPVADQRDWTVLATWADAQTWRAALDGAGPWQDAMESWSCLLAAGPTRDNPAAAAWADGSRVPPFGAASADEPHGPVAVVTTVSLAPDLEPALRFARDVQTAIASLADAAGSLGSRLGGAEDFPQTVDALTFSVWASLGDARRWAYRDGAHARAMRDHMSRPHIVRGTFTTFAVMAAVGTCSAVDDDLHRLLAAQTAVPAR